MRFVRSFTRVMIIVHHSLKKIPIPGLRPPSQSPVHIEVDDKDLSWVHQEYPWSDHEETSLTISRRISFLWHGGWVLHLASSLWWFGLGWSRGELRCNPRYGMNSSNDSDQRCKIFPSPKIASLLVGVNPADSGTSVQQQQKHSIRFSW